MDMSSTTPAEVAPAPTTESAPVPVLPAHVAAGLAAYHAGDPDGQTVRVLSARRDLGCNGSGPEEYRRVRYPGATSEVWPAGDRLPACDGRAGTRRCSAYAEVPIGSLLVCFSRDVYRGRRGKCSVEIKLVCPPSETEASQRRGYTAIVCPHRTLRSRPVYEVTLPDGALVEIARREGRWRRGAQAERRSARSHTRSHRVISRHRPISGQPNSAPLHVRVRASVSLPR